MKDLRIVAAEAHFNAHFDARTMIGWVGLPQKYRDQWIADVDMPVVVAVEAAVRAQVAAEIEAGQNWTPSGPFTCQGCPVCHDLWEDEPICTHWPAIQWAAAIARGDS